MPLWLGDKLFLSREKCDKLLSGTCSAIDSGMTLRLKSPFRQERSYCQICWTQVANSDFELSTGKTGATGMNTI
jgi:hypothetical protein